MNLTQLKRLSMIIGGAILLQGCVTATVAGITSVGAVATKVATDPRSVGTQVDDETLEEKVLSAIRSDEQIKSEARINVVSYSGRVLLIGQVPDENLKEIATSLAKGVEGINDNNVYNEIRTAQPITVGQISKDSWITTQVKSKMLVDSAVKTSDIKAITEDGEVFLMGNVTQDQGNSAAEIARNVAGVKKVVKVFNYLN
ncbi:division/outer membrane stress-associated lipid-binding lipoprotein [[Pasteurella] aerogenes]|nr:divisome-associated lipoprotein YraP [[Pasteurella] aerogenes]MCI7718605.1 divisome-associated lipoprotein YraP [[Pasteurella] aerogenes]MCU9999020.1 divisome-associated lipoprotein YraP [[Pasteurella] aerogenes]MDY2796771.1 division/outer membrane stress-associated lipid-binding lipoprotein [[Pasteurella] aerogenes]MDY4480075.1 division/outer membrane stress-associated lipid-binding lipoprotein [[Pasteurella] aerogenes]